MIFFRQKNFFRLWGAGFAKSDIVLRDGVRHRALKHVHFSEQLLGNLYRDLTIIADAHARMMTLMYG